RSVRLKPRFFCFSIARKVAKAQSRRQYVGIVCFRQITLLSNYLSVLAMRVRDGSGNPFAKRATRAKRTGVSKQKIEAHSPTRAGGHIRYVEITGEGNAQKHHEFKSKSLI